MLKAIIMDFDGVIIDSETIYYDIYKEYFFERFNYQLTPQKYSECVGTDDVAFLKEMSEILKVKIEYTSFKEYTNEIFRKKSQKIPLMDGVLDTLKDIKDNDLTLILATSSFGDHAISQLKRLGIDNYFDYIVTGDNVKSVKPNPEIFNKALKIAGVNYNEAIVIEDAATGLKAAQNANISTIVIKNNITKFNYFNGTYLSLKSLDELRIKNIINCKKHNIF